MRCNAYIPILVSVNNAAPRRAILDCLTKKGARIADARLSDIDAIQASLAIIEHSATDSPSGMDHISRFRSRNPAAPVIICALSSSEDHAVGLLRLGVKDYFRWPSEAADVQAWLERNLPTESPGLVGQSAQMQSLSESIRRAASTHSNVPIVGETGTGKELAARSVHQMSSRASQQMISLNCAAIPDTLLESELFGFERGAFTGAAVASQGKLRLAHRGTFFLDEVGDMSAQGQAKLLRVVETGEVCPLGGRTQTHVDTRIIAATNQNLDAMVRAGSFRADLLFRLNVVRIDLPPLRQRPDDIPVLLDYYVKHFNSLWGHRIQGFDARCRTLLSGYDWPGNVRELRNVVEAAYVNARTAIVTEEDLPSGIRALAGSKGPVDERQQLTEALFAMNWNIQKVAEKLKLSRMTVYRRLERYQIRRCERMTEVGSPSVSNRNTA